MSSAVHSADSWPQSNDWEAAGWWETRTPIKDLCSGGGVCFNSGSEAPRSQGGATIGCSNNNIVDFAGNAYNSWPLKVTAMYTRLMPC